MNSEKTGKCEYCSREGKLFVSTEEFKLRSDLFICDICRGLLSSKETAIPLLRGHMSFEARGRGKEYEKNIEKFINMISGWKSEV